MLTVTRAISIAEVLSTEPEWHNIACNEREKTRKNGNGEEAERKRREAREDANYITCVM